MCNIQLVNKEDNIEGKSKMYRAILLINQSIFLLSYASVKIDNEDCCSVTPNIAFNKSTKQSTTYCYVFPTCFDSYLANDGNRQQRNPGPKPPGDLYGICAHTIDPTKPNEWWAVNLGAIFDIFGIIIYGRDDCCSYRLQDYDVDVIAPVPLSAVLTFDTMDNGYITFNQYVSTDTIKLDIMCSDNTRGQFVRLRHRGERVLTLCEVEVYGELSCLSAARVSRHRGFPGHKYQGTTTAIILARSSLECIALCKAFPCSYAGNFNTDNRQCVCTEQIDPATGRGLISSKAWNAFLLF